MSVFAAWPAPALPAREKLGEKRCQRGGEVTSREFPISPQWRHTFITDRQISKYLWQPWGSGGSIGVRDVLYSLPSQLQSSRYFATEPFVLEIACSGNGFKSVYFMLHDRKIHNGSENWH